MLPYDATLAELRSKYFEAYRKRREAKLKIEEYNKIIGESDAEMKLLQDSWTTLRKVFPDMPELDNREAGIFNSRDMAPEITPGLVKDWIIETCKKMNRYIRVNEIFSKVIELHAKDGLNKDHLSNLSQTLKLMRVAKQLVRAKGDESNQQTYWGLPEFTRFEEGVPVSFIPGREPKTDRPITMWDLKYGSGKEE